MADPRFFKVEGPFNIEQLAEISGSKIGGDVNKDAMFFDVCSLSLASRKDVSFLDNPRYVDEYRFSNAGAIVVDAKMVDKAPSGAALLILDDPYLGYARLTQAFYPRLSQLHRNIDEDANVSSSANVGRNIVVECGAVIKKNVQIGDNCLIGANTYIGSGVEIGNNCNIGPNVTLTHCILGDNNIIHPGVRIGQDGFGFAPGVPVHKKVEQLGRVIIGDEVEIGANTAIDRGALADTVIGDGTKIDNLVHIAHNVEIGQGCFITAQNGIAGSAKVGDFVSLGGQAGVAGHVSIGNGVKIAAQSGVTKDLTPGEKVAGTPAQDRRQHWKAIAILKRLSKEKRG